MRRFLSRSVFLLFGSLTTLPILPVLVPDISASVIGPRRSLEAPQKSDRLREEKITITEPAKEYMLFMNSKIDGVRTRMPQVGFAPGAPVWQPNRFMRIENKGNTDVVN